MAIAFVNGTSGTSDNTSHTTRTLTLAITAGNLVVVSGTFSDNGSRDNFITCTDDLSTPTVYNLQLYTFDVANSQSMWTFWGVATVTGTATITINEGTGGGTSFWRSFGQQYSGSFPANPIDAIAANGAAFTTSTDSITSGSKTTVNNGDLIYGFVTDASTGASSFTAGTGFNTIRGNAGSAGVEDKIQSSAGSVSVTFTSNTSGSNAVTHMIAFSETNSNGGLGGPYIYTDFENSTDGTTLTKTILDAGTHNLAGTAWSATGSPFTAMKVATSAERTLISPVTLKDGTQFTDVGNTRGVTFDTSVSTSQYASIAWNFRSPIAIVRFWFATSIPTNDTGDYTMAFVEASNGGSTEFVALHISPNGLIKLETFTGVTSSSFAYAINTFYWVELYYNGNPGASHQLVIYDSTGTLLATLTRANNGNGKIPNNFRLGRAGDSGTPAALCFYDDLLIDGVNGAFPLAPASTPPDPTLFPMDMTPGTNVAWSII